MNEQNQEKAKALLTLLETQEKDLVFDSFSNYDAFKLGAMLSEKISSCSVPLTVRVFIGDIIVYQYVMKGNEESRFGWTYRKYQLLKETGHASMHGKVRLLFLNELTELGQKPEQYGFGCGAFPITVKGEGIIGAVAVSGLPDPEDHFLVVEALEHMLGKKTVNVADEAKRLFAQA